LAVKANRSGSKMTTKTRKAAASKAIRIIETAKVSVDRVVHSLGPDMVARATERSDERSKAARVSDQDMRLQVSM